MKRSPRRSFGSPPSQLAHIFDGDSPVKVVSEVISTETGVQEDPVGDLPVHRSPPADGHALVNVLAEVLGVGDQQGDVSTAASAAVEPGTMVVSSSRRSQANDASIPTTQLVAGNC